MIEQLFSYKDTFIGIENEKIIFVKKKNEKIKSIFKT
jgi:cell division GTPase FtsZ